MWFLLRHHLPPPSPGCRKCGSSWAAAEPREVSWWGGEGGVQVVASIIPSLPRAAMTDYCKQGGLKQKLRLSRFCRPEVWSQSPGLVLSGGLGESPFLSLSQLQAVALNPGHLLVCRCITSTTASIVTSPSALCHRVFSFSGSFRESPVFRSHPNPGWFYFEPYLITSS